MKRCLLILSACMLPLTAQGEEHNRDSWYIGFGLGGGYSQLTVGGESYSYSEYMDRLGFDSGVQLGLNFQVGATISPSLLVGGEISAMSWQGHEGETSAQLQHSQYLAVVTWFPREEGLYLKGGAGYSSLLVVVDPPSSGPKSDTVGGFGGTAGLGYAFWLGERFNLVIQNDFHIAAYDGGDTKPTSGMYDLLSLGFMWY